MSLRPYLPRIACATFLLVSMVTGPAWAGLQGQPLPSLEISAKIRAESVDILKGNVGTGRPNLFLLVQSNAATDFTSLVARVVGDDTTYVGLTDTLDDAIMSAKDDANRQFIIYNLAQVNLLRSKFLTTTRARRQPLTAAADAAARFSPDLRDPIAWQLKGDIDAELEDLPAALAAYKQFAACGASPAEVKFRYGYAYEKSNRIPEAYAQYHAAQLAQSTSNAGGSLLRHRIYQGLTRVELNQGDEHKALASLSQSAQVEQDPDAPFRFELGAANDLLGRGYAAEVLTFAQAALRIAPDDENARDLRDRAQAAKVRGR